MEIEPSANTLKWSSFFCFLLSIVGLAFYYGKSVKTPRNALDVFPKGSVDAFDRKRVSQPATLFDSQSQYDASPLLFNEKTANGGSLVYDENSSSVYLNTNTLSGSMALRQSKRYFHYYPGKSQLIMISLTGAPPKDHLYQEYGYGDDENGIFFAVRGLGLQIVRRTSTSGTPVDEAFSQEEWDIDRMDGTGPSGVTLDMSKAQTLAIDLEWLGVGLVRVGFVFNGTTYYCHGFKHSNFSPSVYMKTANLPVRWKLENTSTTLTESRAQAICTSVSSEAGFSDQYAYPFTVSNNVAGRLVSTTETPLLALRPALTFKGQTNRVSLVPVSFDHYAHTSPVLFRVYYNAEVSGGSWTSVNSESTAEVNATVTGFSGGINVAETLVPASKQGNTTTPGEGGSQLLSILTLNLDIDGLDPDMLVVTGQTMISSTNTPVVNSITWKEQR